MGFPEHQLFSLGLIETLRLSVEWHLLMQSMGGDTKGKEDWITLGNEVIELAGADSIFKKYSVWSSGAPLQTTLLEVIRTHWVV